MWKINTEKSKSNYWEKLTFNIFVEGKSECSPCVRIKVYSWPWNIGQCCNHLYILHTYSIKLLYIQHTYSIKLNTYFTHYHQTFIHTAHFYIKLLYMLYITASNFYTYCILYSINYQANPSLWQCWNVFFIQCLSPLSSR